MLLPRTHSALYRILNAERFCVSLQSCPETVNPEPVRSRMPKEIPIPKFFQKIQRIEVFKSTHGKVKKQHLFIHNFCDSFSHFHRRHSWPKDYYTVYAVISFQRKKQEGQNGTRLILTRMSHNNNKCTRPKVLVSHSNPATDKIVPNLRDSAIKTSHVKQQLWKIF